eukprot:COSAG02_NODE_6979_length_3251_cov_2.897843_1_plen_360_part_00
MIAEDEDESWTTTANAGDDLWRHEKCVDLADGDTIRHSSTSAVSESIVPEPWSRVRGEDDSPMAVPLDATNPAHKELWDSIASQMQEVGDVICIARNEHYDLWESFVQEKRKLLKKLSRSASLEDQRTWNIGSGCYSCKSGSSHAKAIPQNYGGDADADVLHERPLFHTTQATTETIFREGFDSRLSNQGCFGRGIYFSDVPKKCDKYWTGQPDARVMFIAQVLLGEAKVFPRGQNDRSLKREPERGGPTDRYDSVRGFMSVGDEFVVYQNDRAFPMFAVYYTPKGEDVRSYMKRVGLDAWYYYFNKYLPDNMKSVHALRATTSADLRRMATKANMRLDARTSTQESTVDQVLKALNKI